MKKRVALVAFLLGLVLHVAPCADLKEYIMVVKPTYYEKTRSLFVDLATYFDRQNVPAMKTYFQTLAGEYGHGTGWVVVDTDGSNYIITNRHVVAQASTVNVYFEKPDGKTKSYLGCPILYVDNDLDLAVCEFPERQKLFESGLKLDDTPQKDLAAVVAAGFPGFGSTPLWQVAMGNITNAQAKIDPAYAYLIQHSAAIDAGNSGGPLLAVDPSSDIGFKVIGVNTWKAKGRESTNFAIPAKDVKAVLVKARKARAMIGDAVAIRAELTRNAKILGSELSSEHPDRTKVARYISYAFVGEKGWQAFTTLLGTLSETDKKDWWDYFYNNENGPVEAMRSAVYIMFWTGLKLRGDITSLQFKEINYADDDEIASKDRVRTNFTIGQKKVEIVWSMEYGQWRVSNLELPTLK
jgi:serine protease Do